MGKPYNTHSGMLYIYIYICTNRWRMQRTVIYLYIKQSTQMKFQKGAMQTQHTYLEISHLFTSNEDGKMQSNLYIKSTHGKLQLLRIITMVYKYSKCRIQNTAEPLYKVHSNEVTKVAVIQKWSLTQLFDSTFELFHVAKNRDTHPSNFDSLWTIYSIDVQGIYCSQCLKYSRL